MARPLLCQATHITTIDPKHGEADPIGYGCPTTWGPIPAAIVAKAVAALVDDCLECFAAANELVGAHPDPAVIYTYTCVTAVRSMEVSERVSYTTGWETGVRRPSGPHPIAAVITSMTDPSTPGSGVHDMLYCMHDDDSWRTWYVALEFLADFCRSGRPVRWD